MNKVEFEKWIDEMVTEYCKKILRFEMAVDNYRGITLCGDRKTGKCGMARCHPDDEFNDLYGEAIAYARCRGYKIPKLTTTKKLSEMKYGDKFLDTFGNKQYAFIGKSTNCDRYIVENITEGYLCYVFDEEYEMVE